MTRRLLLSTSLLLAATFFPNNRAQAQFAVGDDVVGLGVGLLGTYNYGWKGAGFSRSPVINLQYDHGLMELGDGVLGLGGLIGYSTAKYDYSQFGWGHRYRFSSMLIAARGTWHYNEWHGDSKLDTYAALGLGLYFHKSKFRYDAAPTPNGYVFRDNDRTSTSGYLGLQVGARYWFSPNVSGFAELGYGMSWLQVGVAMKL